MQNNKGLGSTILRYSSAFTIVELLVVIVIIGILATLTIVSYTNLSTKATIASLTSDLDNASKQLKLDQVINSGYPTTLASANSGKGIPASAGTTYLYSYNNSTNPQGFCIAATKGTTTYRITNDSSPALGDCMNWGLLAYYPFNGNANDLSGNNYNATVFGPVLTTGQNGSANSAYSFDGVSNTITTPAVNNDVHSVSFWLKKTDPWAVEEVLFLETRNTGVGGFTIKRQGTNDLNAYFVSNSIAYRVKDYTVSWFILDGIWHHYVLSFNKLTSQVSIYRDGIFYKTITSDYNTNVGTTLVGLTIGVRPGYAYFKGIVDDIRLYNRPMLSDEVQALYLTGTS